MSTAALNNLDEASQKEILAFVEAAQSRASLQSSINNFVDTCFPKCVTRVSGDALSATEKSCLANCADRFLDVNLHIVKQFEKMQGR